MSTSLYFGQIVIGPAGSGKVCKHKLPETHFFSQPTVKFFRMLLKHMEEISSSLTWILLLINFSTAAILVNILLINQTERRLKMLET